MPPLIHTPPTARDAGTAVTGRTVAVMDAIRRKLAARVLLPGEKLPSIRAFAVTMGVSPSTVVEAYDRLGAEGVIHARQGSGFFVSGPLPSPALAEARPALDLAIDPLWVSQQSLDAQTHAFKPGCGWLPPDWMPHAAIRRAMRGLARADAEVLVEYGSTHGSLALRRILARQFAAEGCPVGADQLLLTASDS
jgi:DNA-binding transcriptional MocR family regulator